MTEESLNNCWMANDDGAGVAWAYKGQLYVFKELKNFDTFYNYYNKLVETIGNESPMILHFRIKTHGPINLSNCHPFLVNENLAMVHNGILSIDVPKDSTDSDTAVFNKIILRKLPEDFLNNGAIITLLEKFCIGSKLIFLDSLGNYKIINEKSGDWIDGIWYSNNSHKPRSYTAFTNTTTYSCNKTWGNYGNWKEWDSDTGFPKVETTTPVSCLPLSASTPTVAKTPSVTNHVANRDKCLLCMTETLTTATEIEYGVCVACQARHGWAVEEVQPIIQVEDK
jgi:hypothetical protein